MKSIWFSPPLSALFVVFLVASASAQGYPPEIITAPVVAPITITNQLISGELLLLYPDGTPVTLADCSMTVRACGTGGCIEFKVPNPDASITCPPEVAGHYKFTIDTTTIPGFPTGTVTLYIVAGSMTDRFGRHFPAVDTLIGTITVPAGSPPPGTASQPQGQKPKVSSKPSLYRIARSATEAAQQSPPSYTIPGVLSFLVIAGTVMVLAPRRRPT